MFIVLLIPLLTGAALLAARARSQRLQRLRPGGTSSTETGVEQLPALGPAELGQTSLELQAALQQATLQQLLLEQLSLPQLGLQGLGLPQLPLEAPLEPSAQLRGPIIAKAPSASLPPPSRRRGPSSPSSEVIEEPPLGGSRTFRGIELSVSPYETSRRAS